MKILQVAYKSEISGGERVLFDLAATLSERGHEVLAVCPRPGQLPEALKQDGVRTEIVHFAKTYDLSAAAALARLLGREKIEVLHSHSLLTNIIARIAGRWAKVPVSISTEHLTMELGRGGRGVGPGFRLRAAYYRMLGNFTSRYNHAVVAVSDAVKRDLVEQGMPETRVRVIRNGIRLPPGDSAAAEKVRRELGAPPGRPLIGTAGRLSPQKDYPTLLRAAKEVLKVRPDALFLIAGEGKSRGDLEALSRELGVMPSVRFLGYRPDVLAVLAALDIFVLSSLWEGLPLAVLEAMAMSKPVVATAVPGTAEAVVNGETGFLVPLADFRALAGKIIELLGNEDRGRKLGRAGRERAVKHFSLDRMVDEHEALYRELGRRSF